MEKLMYHIRQRKRVAFFLTCIAALRSSLRFVKRSHYLWAVTFINNYRNAGCRFSPKLLFDVNKTNAELLLDVTAVWRTCNHN